MADVDQKMNSITKRKIVFCIDSPGWGGSEINAVKLLQQLRNKYDLEMVVNPNAAKQVTDFIKENTIESKAYFYPARIKYLFSAINYIRKRIIGDENNIYIVWLHHLNSNRWLQVALAMSRRKFIIVEQLLPTSYEIERHASKLSIPLKNFIARRASAVVICAYSQKATYLKNIKATNPVVIPNSRKILEIYNKIANIRATNLKETRAINICCVGRLTSQKDQKTLIAAVALLNNVFDLEVTLVGDGEDKQRLIALAKDLQVNMHITGFVSDVMPYLAMADIFVLPSTDEGLPGALIEAMSGLVPCIGSDIPGTKELIKHNETGLIFPVGDHIILSERIKYLLQNSEEAERFSNTGFNYILENYDESIEVSLWFRLLESECLN